MAGGVALMARFGQAGFIAALPLMWIAQRIRLQHDREWGERCKENPFCMGFVAVYLLLLMVIAISMVMHHRDPTKVAGFAGSIVVFMLPFIIGMLAADFRVCSTRTTRTRLTAVDSQNHSGPKHAG
jgi:peptidoglycan/LPS O-acetylase OafA/YrhL